jgi:CRISPR system Cascade subunit CasD
MPRHLILRLEAPLMAFGDVMIDAIGPIRLTPSASSLTGMLANALGYRRWEGDRLQRLQDRLLFGCRVDRRGTRFTDFQTAQLEKNDKGWMTDGSVEDRAGGTETYRSPHIRRRDYVADACLTIALRLTDPDESPTLDAIAAAIAEPTRPLFLGRKTCLPAAPMIRGFVDGATVYEALLRASPEAASGALRSGAKPRVDPTMLIVLPPTEPMPVNFREVHGCERRDWRAGVHVGDDISFHGEVPATAFASNPPMSGASA